ncbi:MAG: FkbM family methyltransferase [Verrucomicrobiota bacterium]
MNWKTPIALLTHSGPCVGGLLRRYDPGLAKARYQLLFKGHFTPFLTKEGYRIENKQQLYCYFDFAWEAIVFRGGWTETLPENATILDVGANYGTFGWLCRKRWPKATIIGFEPMPELAKYCEKLGCYNQVHPVALSLEPGTATLHIDTSLGLTASLGGNKLLDYKSSEMQVEVKRLDDFGLKPDFMKVDVDGGELQLILGGYKTFKHCPKSVIECTGSQRHKTVADLLQKKSRMLYFFCGDYLFED